MIDNAAKLGWALLREYDVRGARAGNLLDAGSREIVVDTGFIILLAEHLG